MMQMQQRSIETMLKNMNDRHGNHQTNAQLDERSFRRCEKFSNKEDTCREWKQHFLTAVRECDTDFANYLWAVEKRDMPIDMELTPTYTQLSAVLYSRLIALSSGEAFSILQMHDGHGVEGWRLLTKRFDPKTDARLTTLILSLFTYKIKAGDILGGMADWESKMLILERDYSGCELNPKMKRALLMHVLSEKMKAMVMEHLAHLVYMSSITDFVSLCLCLVFTKKLLLLLLVLRVCLAKGII